MLTTLVDAAYSIDLSRERSALEIVGATLGAYRRYPLLFAALAVGLIAGYELLILLVAGVGPLAKHRHVSQQATILIDLFSFSLIGPLISALHVHAVVLIGEGRRPRLVEVAQRGLAVLPVVAAAEIVANLGILAGTYAFTLPGLYLSIRWSVVAQAASIEREGWLPALRRGWRLTSGAFWHVLAVFLILGIPFAGVYLGARAIAPGSGTGVASVALGIAVFTVLASIAALSTALLYFDLVARAIVPREPGENS